MSLFPSPQLPGWQNDVPPRGVPGIIEKSIEILEGKSETKGSQGTPKGALKSQKILKIPLRTRGAGKSTEKGGNRTPRDLLNVIIVQEG